MDWLGKFLDLPKEHLNCSDGPGGGVIQGTFVHCLYNNVTTMFLKVKKTFQINL